ncbi:TonB family protein [Paraferrimonas sedimenticola]|uniref:Cell envelope biogenesis protein TonB n=1 Tax=Paraferrimonas sedimenticola TaxID=375674 RepID=A0AA37VS73_9GAMM|nr:TonB family protein [Paraferrimonas sedimenticola]GLP94779.1 cell envelope biogenesis protein TonB [Paraferrimonas sedimenticola]
MSSKLWFGAVIACFLPFSGAHSSKTDDFSTAYKAYNQALETDDKSAITQHAKTAFELGCKKFGDSSTNCASLMVNYANSLPKELENAEETNELLEDARNIFLKLYGENSVEVAETYLSAAELYGLFPRRVGAYAGEAIDIGNAIEAQDPVTAAQIYLEAGKTLLKMGSKQSRVLIRAYELFKDHLEPDDDRFLEARSTLGAYYRAAENYSESIALFEENIAQLDRLGDSTNPYDVYSRAQLVELYERLGKSDEATRHCLAIGAMKPWDPNQEAEPLYKVNPDFPISKIRNVGMATVHLSFDISETGFVENIEVIESTKGFSRYAKKALKQWRYAPKFENGEPVVARSTVSFSVERVKP